MTARAGLCIMYIYSSWCMNIIKCSSQWLTFMFLKDYNFLWAIERLCACAHSLQRQFDCSHKYWNKSCKYVYVVYHTTALRCVCTYLLYMQIYRCLMANRVYSKVYQHRITVYRGNNVLENYLKFFFGIIIQFALFPNQCFKSSSAQRRLEAQIDDISAQRQYNLMWQRFPVVLLSLVVVELYIVRGIEGQPT